MNHDAVLQRPQDPGLQAERTALAWNRTGFAVLVNALLVLRSEWASDEKPITVMASLLLVALGAVIFYGARRRRELLSDRARVAASTIDIFAVAVVALCACGVGVASMLL